MDLLSQLQKIKDLPTIPTTLIRVLRITAREDTNASDLARVITADQALAAKILQVANSSLYSLPRQVHDIQQAVTLLGFREVRDISLGISTFESLYIPTRGAYWNRAKFWEHCYAVGYLTREVAKAVAGSKGSNAFAAGLLHDIGKVILDRYFPQVFRQIIEQVDASQERFYIVESALLGTGHEVLGSYLLSVWNLPDDLVAGVSGHHWPSVETEDIAAWVYLANGLAHVGGFASMPSEAQPTLEQLLEAVETQELKKQGRLPSENILTAISVRLEEEAEDLSAQAAMIF